MGGNAVRSAAGVKGKGCDCKGLIWGAARELGFPEAERPTRSSSTTTSGGSTASPRHC
jgi:hypothetical protein